MVIDRATSIVDVLRHDWAEEVLRWHGVHDKLYPGLPLESLRWTAGIDVDRLLADLRAAARSRELEDDVLPDDPWTSELLPGTPPPAPVRTAARAARPAELAPRR